MSVYDYITVRGWRAHGIVSDRQMLVRENLAVRDDGPVFWDKTMRRLSNCLYVLVTMSTGAQKTFRRLEGERWGKGTDASEADYLSRAILEFYEDSSAASEDPSDSRYSLPS
jgi:hypothetical protein